MSEPRPYPVGESDDRSLGAWCFNRTWELPETPGRTREQDDEMLCTAFASRFHWGRAGGPVNLARGEWQISRVYSTLGRGDAAVRHARRCLEITEEAGIGDFDLAFAYEALARGLALCGREEEARDCAARAQKAAQMVTDEKDRALVLADLATIPMAAGNAG